VNAVRRKSATAARPARIFFERDLSGTTDIRITEMLHARSSRIMDRYASDQEQEDKAIVESFLQAEGKAGS
jgi:hypothetical protein